MTDIVDEIFALFALRGDRSYGENVTQREHALQTAHCAAEAGEPETLIAAALLHDIGQFIEEAGDKAASQMRDARHEDLGGKMLETHFSPAVVMPIRLHVAAKRYLCATDPAYFAGLSTASKLSLKLQGGPFHSAEVITFARLPFADEAIRLRHYDDLGKQDNLETPRLEDYYDLLRRLTQFQIGFCDLIHQNDGLKPYS